MYIINNRYKIKELGGTISLFVTACFFSFFGYLGTFLSNRISLFISLFIIHVGGIILIGLFTLQQRMKILFNIKITISLIAFGLVSILPIFFFNLSLSHEKIGLVLLTQNSTTLCLSFIASFYILKEKINIKYLGLILIILLGIATIYIPITLNNILGLIFPLLVGLSNFVVNILRKYLSKKINSSVMALYKCFIGTLVFVFLILINLDSLKVSFSLDIVICLLLYTLLDSLTLVLLNIGFSNLHFTVGNAILVLEIPLGFLIGLVFAKQSIIFHELTGSLIVMIAIFLVKLEEAIRHNISI